VAATTAAFFIDIHIANVLFHKGAENMWLLDRRLIINMYTCECYIMPSPSAAKPREGTPREGLKTPFLSERGGVMTFLYFLATHTAERDRDRERDR
jgi:hypothetical protein